MGDLEVGRVTEPPEDAIDPGPSVGIEGFMGYRRRLMQIRHGDRVTDVPTGLDAWIEFAADNWVLVNDTIHVASGRFTPVPGGYRIADLPQTAVLYGGHDRLRQAVIDEMLALNRAGTVAASVFLRPESPGTTCLRLTPPAPVVSFVSRGTARPERHCDRAPRPHECQAPASTHAKNPGGR
jgi:hypothetical protein